MKKTDGAGYTMLHLAAQGNHAKLVKYLLDHGANPDGGDSCKCTPLHRASFSRSMEAVGLLVLAGANINVIDTSFTKEHHYIRQQGRSIWMCISF